jgi:protein-disulfide isomerase
MSSEIDEMNLPEEPIDNDVIIIRKSWLVTALVAVIAFALGGATMFLVYDYAFTKGAAAAGTGTGQVAAAGQQQQVLPTATPTRLDNVSVDDDPVLGPDDAPVTIVEFSDFQCPFCARFQQQTFNALREKYGDDIRIVFRDFPLSSLHPDATKASEAAECADDQGKFWEMHDAMFQSQAITGVGLPAVTSMAESLDLDMDEFQECVDSGKYADEVAKDLQEGTSYGVTGTPTFFINGVRLVGAVPIDQFSAIIDEELELAK